MCVAFMFVVPLKCVRSGGNVWRRCIETMATGTRGGYNWRKHVKGGGGGGGGRTRGGGRGGGHYNRQATYESTKNPSSLRVASVGDLKEICHRIDGKQYPAYRDLKNACYRIEDFTLYIDHVQSDPYASPSRVRVQIPIPSTGFPAEWMSLRVRRTALADYLTRHFFQECRSRGFDQRADSENSGWNGKKGGDLSIAKPGQEVLERTSVLIRPREHVEVRLTTCLPAAGRRVLGEFAARILSDTLPTALRSTFLAVALNHDDVWKHICTIEDAQALRKQLAERKLVSFVADGSVLPRVSGASNLPMPLRRSDQTGSGAIPFQSPPSYKVQLKVPHAGVVEGMGIPEGITLIVGGGFHGKSTLLEALQVGVYDHIPGDGREKVVSRRSAVKIRAEDGRPITNVNISSFISNLPFRASTSCFDSADASGSTSQAANIIEALECGASALLVDEDTSATNFMIRDELMQLVVESSNEPITPFIARVRALYTQLGVSTVLVMGGCGDYFAVADHVIMMQSCEARDVTEKAKQVVASSRLNSEDMSLSEFGSLTFRAPVPGSIDASRGRQTDSAKVFDVHKIAFGQNEMDLSALEQLTERCQTQAVVDAVLYLQRSLMDGKKTLRELLAELDLAFDDENTGLDVLSSRFCGTYSRPRRFEVAACINRIRSIGMTQIHTCSSPTSQLLRLFPQDRTL